MLIILNISVNVMLRRLSHVIAVLLLAITITSALNAKPRDTDVSQLRASYAERFKIENVVMFIEWVHPYDLPGLTDFCDAIVYGKVVQRADPPAGLRLEGSVFEVQVYSYLKEPEDANHASILICQLFGEAGNPIIRPGDECVFFLTLNYEQNPGPRAIYCLGGDYTRYVVYEGRVYTVASLNPQDSSRNSGELLPRFMTRVKAMIQSPGW